MVGSANTCQVRRTGRYRLLHKQEEMQGNAGPTKKSCTSRRKDAESLGKKREEEKGYERSEARAEH